MSTPSLAARQGDPFAVLGPHQTAEGWVDPRLRSRRRTRFGAVTREGAPIVALERRKGDFFEGLLPHARGAADLSARGAQRARAAWSYDDAYAFGPALGPLDDYLLLEGTHRQLYSRLGAQITTHEGVGGVLFAVWAPNARAGLGGRRFQPMGRPPLPDAQAHRQRPVGNLRARPRRGHRL